MIAQVVEEGGGFGGVLVGAGGTQVSFGRGQLFREMYANKISGKAGPCDKKSGIYCLDLGTRYEAETCPVKVSDNVSFFSKE